MAENVYIYMLIYIYIYGTNNLVSTKMFVDHVRCLHYQIQTVLKMCSLIKKIIYKFTRPSNGKMFKRVLSFNR